jgi:hypothetical protein
VEPVHVVSYAHKISAMNWALVVQQTCLLHYSPTLQAHMQPRAEGALFHKGGGGVLLSIKWVWLT